MNKRNRILFWYIFLFLLFSLFPLKFFAQLDPESLDDGYVENFGKDSELILERGDLVEIIFDLIRYLLGFIGVIIIIIIVSAGFRWMTAGGNEERVKSAKNLLQNGIVGLIIILFAYAISMFVKAAIQGKFLN